MSQSIDAVKLDCRMKKTQGDGKSSFPVASWVFLLNTTDFLVMCTSLLMETEDLSAVNRQGNLLISFTLFYLLLF